MSHQPKARRPLDHEVFESLLENAVYFMKRASSELDSGNVRFATIAFATGAELLIKARLTKEHWTLILKKPEAANLDSLQSGDIQTVGLADGFERLSRVIGKPVPKDILQEFRALANHRNRIIHFTHKDAGDLPRGHGSENLFGTVLIDDDLSGKRAFPEPAITVCRAWYHIRRLLLGEWARHFEDATTQVYSIQYSMRSIRSYLATIHHMLKPEIDSDKSNGVAYKSCANCDFDAAKESEDTKGTIIQSYECRLCGYFESWVEVPCPESECSGTLSLHEDVIEECDSCGKSISIQDATGILSPATAPGDPDECATLHCSSCNSFNYGPESVIRIADTDFMFCLSCCEVYGSDEWFQCDYCGQAVAGTERDSWISGCGVCDGALANHN